MEKTFGVAADIVRVAALGSAIIAAIWWSFTDALLFTGVFAGLLVPRLVRVAQPFDFAFGVTLLLAAWSTVLGWYRAIWWWDLFVHLLTPGAVAAMIYLVLARLEIVQDMHERSLRHSRWALVILTTSFGLMAAVVWEFLEWLVENFTGARVHVGYDDTIGDLAAGGLGSLIAGVALVVWSETGRSVKRPPG